MGLVSKENVDKAMAMVEKNKATIASGVNKATDTIDKKTGGKHTDQLEKVDDAAKKFAGHADEPTRESTGAAAATAPTSDPATGSESTPD